MKKRAAGFVMKRAFFYYVKKNLFFLLLPYISIICLNGRETALVNRKLHIEDLISFALMDQISEKYEEEAVKAQAVITRTNLIRKIDAENPVREVIKKEGIVFDRIPAEIYRKAVRDTRDVLIYFNKEMKMVPYHEISNGKTRSGKEIFHDENYEYLKSVDSIADQEAADYYNWIYIKKEDFPENLRIDCRDHAGYVLGLQNEKDIFEGMAFAQWLALPSVDFTFEEEKDHIRILCRGRGHGLGFSQYGGSKMAQKGKSYKEILKKYFPEAELT